MSSSASLVAVNGVWVLGLVAIPLAVAAVALVATLCSQDGAWPERVIRICAGLLWLGFVVGITSVGWLALPTAILVTVASSRMPRGQAQALNTA